jgi:fructose-bisphosphate aldolase class II
MPLVSILDELRKAQVGLYAIPCFDTFEMMGTQGILAALEAKRAPGIVGIYSGALDRPSGRAFAAFVRTMADGATVPVSLILDHGASYEHCMKALAYGFSDVMYDGSRLPLEENIATTRMIVRAAHAIGAAVEAELGHVGRGQEYRAFGGQGQGFTDPAAVERFVAETGVDFLAVAIGTAHGLYDGEPHLNLALLADIQRRVDVPLVLHGGSGLSDNQFRSVIARGVAKINVFTNLARAAATGMAEAAQAQDPSFLSITGAVQEAFQEGCEHCLDVFGASGKA